MEYIIAILGLLIIIILHHLFSIKNEKDAEIEALRNTLFKTNSDYGKLVVKLNRIILEKQELEKVIEKLNLELNDEIYHGELLKFANERLEAEKK